MKTILPTLLLSCITLMSSASVMAHDDQRHYSNSNWHQQHNQSWKHKNQQPRYVKPVRDWKIGQTLPNQFHTGYHTVNYKNVSRLNRPNRNQQWLKINGDYVLINQRNHKIVRIVS